MKLNKEEQSHEYFIERKWTKQCGLSYVRLGNHCGQYDTQGLFSHCVWELQ